MRLIQNHVVNPVNDKLQIAATDEPGAGGANHRYVVSGFQTDATDAVVGPMVIDFQNGPINEAGVNGVTQEVLLAIVIDRLRSFQSGPFSSRPNALALTHCEEALNWLHYRTLDRMRRGVEGQTKA